MADSPGVRAPRSRSPTPTAPEASGRWCFFSPGLRTLRVLEGDSRSSGGAEAQIAYLMLALVAQGHVVTLVYGNGDRLAPPRVVSGVLCLDAAPAWFRPGSLPAFWRVLIGQEADVLYARLPSDFLLMMGLAARRRLRTRFVYALAHDLHARALSAYDHRRWFHAPLFALGLRLAHRITVQHGDQRAALAPRLRARAAFVPNIVRAVRNAPRAYEATRHDAVWVAKIRSEKRLDLFLDLAQASPGLTFAIIGGYDPLLPPGEREALERRAASLANVTVLGEMRAPDVLTAIMLSKVLVNTSDAEGFPNTMLEAWSVGVPVVSLSIDPGGVIGREGLGAISRDPCVLARDVAAFVRDKPMNLRCGQAGLAYIRRQHAEELVCRRLAEVCLAEVCLAEVCPAG